MVGVDPRVFDGVVDMTEDVSDLDGIVVIVDFLVIWVGVGAIVIVDTQQGGRGVVDGGWYVLVIVDP